MTGVSIGDTSGIGCISAIVSTSPGKRSTPDDSVRGIIDEEAGSIGATVSIGTRSAGPITSGTTAGRTTVGVLPTRTPVPSLSGT